MKRVHQMVYEEISWRCDGQRFQLGLDRMGSGPLILLLPALSSISTRRELHPLQTRLSNSFETLTVDWPGFGDLTKPFLDWRPEIYEAYLDHLLSEVVDRPFAIIAAGHGAGYLLRRAARQKFTAERLVLLSPTWRGPLPTMMNGYRPLFLKIASVVDQPAIGPALYKLNVNRAVVGMMARGHVYEDPQWLKGERMKQKLAVPRVRGSRHGSVRFVTGRLDPFNSRNAQLEAAASVYVPMLNLFSDNAPTKSRTEMEVLAELQNVETVRIPKGKLSFYEEFPDDALEAMKGFLTKKRGLTERRRA